MIKTLRHNLGLAKYRIEAMTWGRWLAHRAKPCRAKLGQLVEQLPAIPEGDETGLEVHTLCGRRDIDMAVIATWSLLRFLPGARLFVHEDGSIQEPDLARWRRVVPTLEFVSATASDHQASQVLSKLPTLKTIRDTQLYGRKLIDIHLFGQSRKLIMIDSDVLCFSEPTAVVSGAVANDRAFAWNQDVRNSYVASPEQLRTVAGHEVANRVNMGFAVVPRLLDEDFQFLDSIARRVSKFGLSHHWMEQTLYAFMARRQAGSAPLPDCYNVVPGPTLQTQTVRHYVGSAMVRPRFFLEGITRLERELQENRRVLA